MDLINLYSDIYSNPAKWSGYRKDFHTDEELTEFIYTQIASGTAAVIDTAAVGNYGVLRIANNGTDDNSGAGIQYDAATIALIPNRTTLFSVRIKASEVTQSDFKVGLNVTGDTDLITSIVTGIHFRKDDGDALIDLYGITNSVAVVDQAAVATLVADTWTTLTFRFVMSETAGTGTCHAYIDGTLLASIYSTTWPASATYALTTSAAYQSGDASTADTFDLDFIEAWVSRVKVD